MDDTFDTFAILVKYVFALKCIYYLPCACAVVTKGLKMQGHVIKNEFDRSFIDREI